MSNSIYSEVKGEGHNIVLLHGWGMHGGLWGKFKDLLINDFRVHAIDLPGFGFSNEIKNDFTLDALTESFEKHISQLKKPVSLIGWSLGGLITLNILKRKNIILNKVVFIATTPCFTKKEGWGSAMEQSVFNGFSKELNQDYKKTLKRFLSLQVRGSGLSRDDLRTLNDKLNERGEPNKSALENGLDILNHTDLRDIKENKVPIMIVLGEKDTLVPLSVKEEFKKMFTHPSQLIIEKAGHAPFISKPEICASEIKKFINE